MKQSKPVLPKVPEQFKVTLEKTAVTGSFSTQLTGYFPFYYAGIQSIWIWWQVELKLLDALLKPLGLKAARFANGGDMGLVNINFFSAAALYGVGQPGNPGVGGFNETELNIAAYPLAVEAAVPSSYTVEAFIAGADQTKRIGNYRVWVACDNAVAVAAGIARYFENKFLTAYDFNIPNLNNDPKQTSWDWTCYDAKEVQGKPIPNPGFIYQATVNLQGLSPVPGNMSEWIDISIDPGSQRPVASRRNYFGLMDTFFLDNVPGPVVTMGYGKSRKKMRADMQQLIGSRPAFAVQRYVSPPVIAEAAPYYADL
jgi:hypothetical protein